MLGHQSPGEGVIGQDQPFTVASVRGLHTSPAEGGANPERQLTSRLSGEGESEDPVRPDRATADQPHHPGGHHRGLARSCAGDNDTGGELGGDRGKLLLGEPDSQQVGELPGSAQVAAHRSTCPPRPDAGQLSAKAHRRHCGPGAAWNWPSATTAAACEIRW